MVGDGDSGETGGSDETNGPASEPAAPSSRGKRALVATGVGEHSGSFHRPEQSSSDTASAALEREVHRFQLVSRQGRSQRKKPRGRAKSEPGAIDNKGTRQKQLTTGTDRTTAVSASQALSRRQTPSSAGTQQAGTVRETESERVWTAELLDGPDTGDARSLDAARADLASLNADGNADLDGGATAAVGADEQTTAQGGKRARRGKRKPSANDLPTRLVLAIIAAEWKARIAAFGYPGRVAPPKPYCPTNYKEAYDLTTAQRQALSKDQIRHLNVKAGKLVLRALSAALVFEQWRDAIAQLPVDMQLIDNFATYARAFGHSDTLISASFEVVLPDFAQEGEVMALTPQQRLQRLVELTRAARARLKLEVEALIDLGAIPEGALRNLKGRSGHYNAGFDVLALLELLRNAAARGANVRIAERDIGRATVLAQKLMEATSRQSSKRGGEARASALEQRARALTLLWLAFWEGRNALAQIFGQRLDVSVVLPTLVVNAGGGRRR